MCSSSLRTRGPNTWAATLSLGTVVAAGFAGDTESRQRPVLLVELADGGCAVRPLVSAAPTLLPAGHVTVRQSTDPTDDPRAWPMLAEGELAPGATLRLEP